MVLSPGGHMEGSQPDRGYDNDPWEIHEFADARCQWARCAGLDDPAEAIRWFGPLSAAARLFPQDERKAIAGFTFLCAYGVFGETTSHNYSEPAILVTGDDSASTVLPLNPHLIIRRALPLIK